ncbi:hypothetical protein BDV3_000232 [Batrachochytrium dendrobatidis]|uniref:P-loop containing nucleoside triphosphate hydrolase protein n=1 Tax=Batrachochytrium dendrobatidis (strain JEL423) TaxID=403673 RepID=A0A177WCU4_BATDL|nr:hypothetical protein BDEG_21250 [Batrachochytrium dendrobatidis JEL423]
MPEQDVNVLIISQDSDGKNAVSTTITTTGDALPPKSKNIAAQANSIKPSHARQDVNFLSKWTYTYMDELIRRGAKRTIEPSDFPCVEDDDESQRLSSAVLEAWAEQQRLHGKNASLGKALWKVFWLPFSIAGMTYLIESMIQIAQGVVLGHLLQWFQDPTSDTKQGCLFAMGLAICVFGQGVLHHVDFFYAMRTGMQVRVSLIAAIYRKCLALSISNTSSTGLIINLVSNDVQRFEDASVFAHFVWVGPIQTMVVFYVVYLEIGLAAIAAIGALLLMIPLQSQFARQFAKLRRITVELRDERIKNISDMLSGIMIVKLYAWETPFVAKINSIRDAELKQIRKASILKSLNEGIFFVSITILELFAFITFFLINGVFTSSRVFTVITYLQSVRLTMTNFFPKAIQFTSESLISLKRIKDFLSLSEINQDSDSTETEAFLESLNDPRIMIAIQNASFNWGDANGLDSNVSSKPNREILSDITLRVRKGELVGVCGPVGSGKSSLINAILGEMNCTGGKVGLRSRKIGYATQTPWIVTGTIKDNILFGQPYNAVHFAKVLQASALARDLDRLPDREQTVIGERGVTLSGGQRARLSLARTLYYDADIYILDDPLSAVDTAVGRHLFDEALRGLMKDKAVLLVTHQLQHIQVCDTVVLLEDGKVVRTGSYNDVVATNTNFAMTMREHAASDNFSEAPDDVEDTSSLIQDASQNESIRLRKNKALHDALLEDSPVTQELAKEEVAKGTVSSEVYFKYFKSGSNMFTMVLMIIAMVLGQVTIQLADWWLSNWSSHSETEQREQVFPIIFAFLAVFSLFIALGRAVWFFLICLKAGKVSFTDMLHAVFRSPMQFFQSNPHGRLMNRFSKDIALMDEMLPWTFFDFLQCFFSIIGALVLSIIIIPYTLILMPFLAVIFIFLRKYFLATSRQIKRIEALTRSPVYSNIPSTLEGLSTIRAFGAQTRTQNQFFAIQNENTRIFFAFLSSSRWLGFRLDMLALVFLTIVAFAAVLLRGPLGLRSGLVGLMLTNILQLTGLLQWAVRQSAEVENLMVSPERVFEYAALPPEAPEKTSVVPSEHWPEHGDIKISNMSMTYPAMDASNEPPTRVLSDISIHFEPGVKVGIVGRTGAGKSSFLQALFRIVEPSPAGAIVIDGIKTSELGLMDLRSRISIIPQEPFCFKGTLRFNLDPFGRYTDDHLWSVLDAVELKPVVVSIGEKLDAPVSENGSNWSVGERQLICLARAILRDTRLIVMDEATSAVDMRTDQLIQRTIRSEGGLFSNATVLTIAHRLNTVIDYDKILVLDEGKVVEYGTPYALLDKDVSEPGAWFARMVAEMGSEAQDGLVSIANKLRPTL